MAMDWRILIACLVVFGVVPWALTFARKGIYHQIARGLMLAIVPVLIVMLMIPAMRIARLRTINAALEEKSAPAVQNIPVVADTIRAPSVAGQWYPDQPKALEKVLDTLLAKAGTEVTGEVAAIVVPHAGLEYSGKVAACAYRTVLGRTYARVVILAPSHHTSMENILATPTDSAFNTPLGNVPVDVEAVTLLQRNPLFQSRPGAFDGEHAIEAQLVFLQKALKPGFKIVPLLTGQLDLKTVNDAGSVLLGVVDPGTLVVISTDFTHYGPRFRYTPFAEDVEQNLSKLDMAAWNKVKTHDMEGLCNFVNETQATICGRCALGILIGMMSDDSNAQLLRYETSGRNEGDFTNSVSYVAGAVTGPWRKGAIMTEDKTTFQPLAEEDKRGLLKLARLTLEHYLKNKSVPAPEDLGVTVTPPMQQIMGAFVTLHKQGNLRGCIGEIAPHRELYKAVIAHAINAGTNDYRFNQVSADELSSLDFEISALTAPLPVAGYGDIVLGKHGVVLDKNGRSAVFLPQVAPEQGWNIEQTLTHLAMKAGLPPDAWKENARFTVFEAIVFHE